MPINIPTDPTTLYGRKVIYSDPNFNGQKSGTIRRVYHEFVYVRFGTDAFDSPVEPQNLRFDDASDH